MQANICITSLIYYYSLHEACDVAYASPRRCSSHLYVVTLTVADVHVYNPLTVADVYVYNLFRLLVHMYIKKRIKVKHDIQVRQNNTAIELIEMNRTPSMFTANHIWKIKVEYTSKLGYTPIP